MASNLVILGENAVRINVKVNPNMTVLKVLELACTKMKVNSNDYDLKYHNKILDTTNLIRFTNISNNALLELVPIIKSRQSGSIGVWLQLEDGSRLSGDFSSSQSLWEIIEELLEDNLNYYESPAIVYTRLEITGKDQLQQKTLKDIGLVSGKALLRLLNKKESEDQAHVYVPAARKPKFEESSRCLGHKEKSPKLSPSVKPEDLIESKHVKDQQPELDIKLNTDDAIVKTESINMSTSQQRINNDSQAIDNKKKSTLNNEDLNNFKSSVSYLDERGTLLFDITDGTSVLYQDEGDDFFEPTLKDITLMYRDLKNAREQMEESQLCTSAMRILEKTQNQLNLLHKYTKCIIRIHFPNRLVLQTVFKSTETVLDVIHFIQKYLIDESLNFYLFTTPPKTILKPEETLLECGCVPSAMIHFACSSVSDYLKPDLKKKVVSGCQASIAAYLVRKERIIYSSNNEKLCDEQPGTSQVLDDQTNIQIPTTTQQKNRTMNKNTPKWFKPM